MRIEILSIESQRLFMRKYRMTDLEDYIEYRGNEALHEFLPTVAREDKSGYKPRLKQIIKGYNHKTDPTMTWAITLKSSNKVIGSVSVERVSERNKCVEVGWALSVKYQHHGYAFEAVKAIIEYLFLNYDINRIEAFIWNGNEASRKLAKRLGFTHEGTNREEKFKNGKYFDVLNMGLLRREFEENEIYIKRKQN